MALGAAFTTWGVWIEPNAINPGPIEKPFGGLLAGVGFILIFFVGFGPWVNRGAWSIMKFKENEFYLDRWQDRCDGPSGHFLIWFSGIDRDGNLIN